MSLAYLPMATAATPPVRRRGRPAVAADPDQRRLHIRCAIYRLIDRRPIPWIADLLGVSPRTVQLWTERALGYDERECEALRRASR